jgi:alpha-N-arabinofuranosidase
VALGIVLITDSLVAQGRVVVNADAGKDTISRHIYGHFSEHLGKCIYGGFYVGEDNRRIPQTRGMRNDVVAALKKIRIPNLRWPGGCFADTYHWKDGVGPKSQRPTIVNTWWGGVTEDNSFGTHEFLDLCEQLGTEPYITGNVGSGTVQELSQWVQYVNFDGKSPMSGLRAANGRDHPWRVRFWGVGNETWGCGGNMTAEYYANVYRTYATFMPSGWGDSRLFRIASGANSADYRWTEVLMRDIPLGLVEGIALHHYSVIDWSKKSSATGFTEQEYALTMQRALMMDELVSRHSTIMDRYDPQKRVALVVDEWGGWYDVEPGSNPGFLYQQNSMRDAMIAGTTLNIFNAHCARVRMANLAQTVNVLQAVILTDEERLVLTPTYHVMEMYTVHHDAVHLPAEVRGATYTSGSITLPALSASASRDRQGIIHLSLVNIDPGKPQEVTVDIRGAIFSTATARVLKSARIQDHNTFDQPDRVTPVAFKGLRMDGSTLRVQLPPCSIVVLALH